MLSLLLLILNKFSKLQYIIILLFNLNFTTTKNINLKNTEEKNS